MVVDVLPRWERYTYWIVGVSGMALSVYALFLEGDKNKEAMTRQLKPGWKWLGRYKDVSDSEYQLWGKTSHIVKIVVTFAHVMVSQICFYWKIRPQLHTYTLIMVDLISEYMIIGGPTMVLLLGSALLMYMVCLVGKIWLVWLLTVVLMYYMHVDSIFEIWIDVSGITSYRDLYQNAVISGFFYIRLTSFAIEKIKHETPEAAHTPGSHGEQHEATAGLSGGLNHPKGTNEVDSESLHTNPYSTAQTKVTEANPMDAEPSFSDLLLYSFYWPTFLFGPTFMYRDFSVDIKNAFCSQNFVPDICDILKQLIRILFWAVFLEFQSHFLYHIAITKNFALFEQAPYSAVAGIMYWHAQYFMIKYVIFYGLPIEISRFDGISHLARPRCLSWVYTFSDIWKYFDVGLYNFTKYYIYVPLGGSRVGVCRQIFAAGVAFAFIIFWHKLSMNTAILFLGNYLINCLQAMAGFAENSDIGRKLKSRMGPALYLRTKAVLCVPCYITCGSAMSHFFFGTRIGSSMTQQLVTQASWTNVIAFGVVMTACVHNGMYIAQIYRQRKDRLTQ